MSVIDIMRAGRILPRYYQLLVRLLEACVEDGYYIYQQINQHNYYKKNKNLFLVINYHYYSINYN